MFGRVIYAVPACKHCRFWAAKRDGQNIYGLYGHDTDGSLSECRVRSPQHITDSDNNTKRSAVFPITAKDDWCGEFDSI